MTEATAELFESAVNQHISVQAAAGVEQWRVVSVKRLPTHAYRAQPFAAYLDAPAGTSPLQGERSGVFPSGEEVQFFAVPVGATREAVSYEVIFN